MAQTPTHALGDPLVFEVLDVPIAYVPTDALISRIVAAALGREGLSVYMLNAHTLNLAHGDPRYRGVLRRGDIVVNDGVGVRIAARLAGVTELDNQNGTDLFPAVIEAAAPHGLRVFWLGGVEGRAEAAAKRLEADYPGATVVGTHHGFFTEDDTPAILEMIRAADPHLVLVSFGNPRQEAWIDAHLDELGGAVAAGVGALVDRFAGQVSRPPAWVRKVGMEWFARLLQYPRVLWRRYLIGNPAFLWRIARNRPKILTRPSS